MTKLAKYSRTLALLLSLIYACSLTGMGSVFVLIGENIESQFFFPCKGSGCQCDRAGRELPNCRCDHTKDSQQPSCCSTTEFEEESSCCSEDESFFEEESCCGSSSNDFSEETISPMGCGGIEVAQAVSTLKHPLFFSLAPEYKLIFNAQNIFQKIRSEYSFNLPFELLKVPICFSKI